MNGITYDPKQLITFEKAQAILGVSRGELENAIERRVLSVALCDNKPMLLKEQVKLFKGIALSVRSLSTEQYDTWTKYNRFTMNKGYSEMKTGNDSVDRFFGLVDRAIEDRKARGK